MKVTDIARAIAPEAQQDIVGIRPGEKLLEQMIGPEDAPHAFEYDEYYKILPAIHGWGKDPERINGGKLVATDFTCRSANNREWMSIEELQVWISQNREKIGNI
jgi:UDP-N-acetylglucosamine 4,6-dehydratase